MPRKFSLRSNFTPEVYKSSNFALLSPNIKFDYLISQRLHMSFFEKVKLGVREGNPLDVYLKAARICEAELVKGTEMSVTKCK